MKKEKEVNTVVCWLRCVTLPPALGVGVGGRAGLHWGPQGVLCRQNSFSASWGPGNPLTGSLSIHSLLQERSSSFCPFLAGAEPPFLFFLIVYCEPPPFFHPLPSPLKHEQSASQRNSMYSQAGCSCQTLLPSSSIAFPVRSKSQGIETSSGRNGYCSYS